MSRKNKYQIEDLDAPILVDVIEGETAKPKIPFTVWFDKLVKSGKIRDHQDEALLIFFRKQGLEASEEFDTYDKAFASF